MFKENSSAVRVVFGVLAFLYALIFAGKVAEVILLLRKNAHVQVSPLFIAQALFVLMVAVAYGWVVARFWSLILDRPRAIKVVVHSTYWGSLGFGLIYLIARAHVNYVGLVVSTIVYIYLISSVNRLSGESGDATTAQSSAAPDQRP